MAEDADTHSHFRKCEFIQSFPNVVGCQFSIEKSDIFLFNEDISVRISAVFSKALPYTNNDYIPEVEGD